MKLVIVESPTKAKTISKFLGKDYKVESSYGHMRDLPKRQLGVEVDNNYQPKYLVLSKSMAKAKELKALAKKADFIYLATDEDREGEAISWHLLFILGTKESKTKRIAFHEITKEAVLSALAKPRQIDLNLVNAQQGRRILDRLVGYKLSPLLWKKIRKGLSAGRVQSAALKLIVDREREREKFKSQEYWSVAAKLNPKSNAEASFPANLTSQNDQKLDRLAITNQTEADKIKKELNEQKFVVKKITKKEVKRQPSPAFTTSTLQQAAANRFGFSGKKTMLVAQQLYEGIKLGKAGQQGLITYMRTDSVNLASKALEQAKLVIEQMFGKDFALTAPRYYQTKSKNAQEAHEAIRPTDLSRLPDDIKDFLTADQLKLYTLIWRRALASQAQTATLDSTAIDVEAGQFGLRANGLIVKFAGWLKIYPQTTQEEILPQLTESEELNLIEVETKQHFTEPPARFSDATLIKTLEKEGIGRPSTYAPTISTLIYRSYIVRENRYFKPEEIGMVVSDLLTKHFPKIVDLKFTAKMEDKLDDIARGQVTWQKVIDEFYQPFSRELMKKTKTIAKLEEKTDKICPECGKNLVIKFGRFGKFYACPGFPQCKYTEPIKDEAAKEMEQAAKGQKCEKCGRDLVVKNGRFGPFMACSGYPECKNIKNINKKTGANCPQCQKGEIVERRSKKGKIFYACDQYPSCKFALWQKPTGEKCPKCSSLLVYAAGDKIKCYNKDCDLEKSNS